MYLAVITCKVPRRHFHYAHTLLGMLRHLKLVFTTLTWNVFQDRAWTLGTLVRNTTP